MLFYCPKCGEFNADDNCTEIIPGTRFTCSGCENVYSVAYDVVFDADQPNAARLGTDGDGQDAPTG